MKDKLYRITDANLNRSREGLRVIEDIIRFYFDNKRLAGELKKIRHDITDTAIKENKELISNRDSHTDVGKSFFPKLEGAGKSLKDLIVSNFRRAEESLRVLEEVSKIHFPKKAGVYKRLRFRVYILEKKIYEGFERL